MTFSIATLRSSRSVGGASHGRALVLDILTVGCGSVALYASAITIYEDLFKRAPELEPDMGLGERYESGRRALLRRQAAEEWRIAEPYFAAARALLAQAHAAQGEAVIEAIETLPAELTALLDRRRTVPAVGSRHRRRWSDAAAIAAATRSRV